MDDSKTVTPPVRFQRMMAEHPTFARRGAEEGITFIGPAPEHMELSGDKFRARELARSAGVPIVPGTPDPITTEDEALASAREAGYPVIVKAAAGGGGRGMRVARDAQELEEVFPAGRREAKATLGAGTLYLERFVQRPRHIEVQILGDATVRVVHLWERDCSVQPRHQKIVEVAPAVGLDAALRG